MCMEKKLWKLLAGFITVSILYGFSVKIMWQWGYGEGKLTKNENLNDFLWEKCWFLFFGPVIQ